MLSMINDKILIETRIDRSQNQHMLGTTIPTATKINICSVPQNQHMLSTTKPTTTKVNIRLSAERLGTSSRIPVIIQIFCRSINTPSSRPTAPSFLNAITWAATGQTLDILNKALKALGNYSPSLWYQL